MRFNRHSLVLVSTLALGSCTPASQDPDNAGGSTQPSGTGGQKAGSGGSPSSSGGSGSTASGGSGSTNSGGSGGGSASGGSEGTASGGTSGGSGGEPGGDDASAGGTTGTGGSPAAPDGGGTAGDSGAPTGPGTIPTDLDGPIPPWDGPPVGPEVKMECPEDPTAGLMEYKDTFRVEHPYDLPTSARFSIEGGIYNFWVMQGDKKHNPTSTAKNPRTEARWSQNFRTGVRMFSADIFWDKSITKGTVVMQVHTTSTGIGPVYMVGNAGGVSPLNAGKVPGGIFDKWINLKVEINASTTASRYWVNNCLVGSMGSGTRGDGNDYFKIGVYHCDAGTCRAKVKNIHLYQKP
jgi:hypothetical protein